MQAFFVSFLFLLPSQHEDPLAQQDLRESFHESVNRGELETFQKDHFFDSVSENYWIHELKDSKTTSPQPTHIESLAYDLRSNFSKAPYRLDMLLMDLFQFASTVVERPVEGLSFLMGLLKQFMFPIAVVIAGICFLQLSLWSTPLRRDALTRFGARSGKSLWAISTIAVILCGLFGTWIYGLLILVSLASVYSWSSQNFRYLALSIALLVSIEPVFVGLQKGLDENIAVESLKEGRNSLEYSPEALDALSTYEKAVWTYWNGDEARAMEMASSSPDLPSKITLANLRFTPAEIERTIESYEKLSREFGGNPVLYYNLAQLHTRRQDLIAADESRSKIDESIYVELSDRSKEQGRLLLFPYERNPVSRFVGSIPGSIVTSLSTYKSNLLDFPGSYLVRLLAIWVIFAGIAVLRKSSSGLCRMLEEATDSRDQELSRLAQLGAQKSEETEPYLRQKLGQYQRKAEGRRSERIGFWSFFVPSSYYAFHNQAGLAAFLVFIPYSLVWFSLPGLWRTELCSIVFSTQAASLNLSGFSMTLFFLGLATYILLFMHTRKRASS